MVDLGKARNITSSYGMGSASGGGVVVMSSSPLFAMRRRDLYRLADAFEVDYSKDAPATEMRQLLMEKGIDGTKMPENPILDKPKADLDVTETLPYEEWKFVHLRQECKRLGIKFVMTDKKHDLLEKLKPAEVLYGQDAS